MILTFEARLPLSDQDGALDAMGVWYGRLKHKLYAQIAKNGGSAKNYKVEFSKEHKSGVAKSHLTGGAAAHLRLIAPALALRNPSSKLGA